MPIFCEAPGVEIDAPQSASGLVAVLEWILDSPVGSLAIANMPVALGGYVLFMLVPRGKERMAAPFAGLVLTFDVWHFGLLG